MNTKSLFALVLCLVAAAHANADDLYLTKVKPMLRAKCSACHGALKQQAGLRLDAGKLILKGSENGPIVNLKNIDDSPLWKRVLTKDEDLRMPPHGEGEALDEKQLAVLRQWLGSGAKFPKSEEVPARPRDHWAFQRPKKSKLPKHSGSNPIDAFIVQQYGVRGVTATQPADRAILLRRLYFNLIGLPPTEAQLKQFLSDASDSAYQKEVDRLLQSPLHSQRWARHWMDVWRYSDWHGYQQQVRGSQRHIWRWRDWIVESIDKNVGYDRMILEMLAGDEIAPDKNETLRATGFLVRNFHNSNRNIWLDATVEHTAKAFVALTLNCARCHDHKYDPIVQKDFYAFRAIFEPHHVRTHRVGKVKDLKKNGLVRVYDKEPKVKTYLYLRGNEKRPDKDNPIAPAVPEFFGVSFVANQVALPKQPPIKVAIKEKGKKTGKSKMVAVPQYSTGRRLALARWIINRQNPLTARVAINHIWNRHFGRPLVERLDDFGLRSPRPRYAKLLDWLAVEFMENGWNMKHIHRLIVNSKTWQLASAADKRSTVSRKTDPDNTYYWRANIRRLESELIRDSVLYVAGSLDTSRGGADIPHARGEKVYRRSLYFQHAYEKQMKMMVLFDGASPNECYRREESVIPQQALVLANSDLSLSQSRKLAREIWKAVKQAKKPQPAFVGSAFVRLLGRPPEKNELQLCQQFLVQQAQRLAKSKQLTQFRGGSKPTIAPAKDPTMRARENLIHVLMNHNDFITIR